MKEKDGNKNLIERFRMESENLAFRAISLKKRRKKYKRKKDDKKRGKTEDKKRKKLNKLHENDLSGVSLGDSILLKTQGNYLIDDKELIKKLKLSQIQYKKKLKEEKRKKRKKKSKNKKKSSKKKKKDKKFENNEYDIDLENAEDKEDYSIKKKKKKKKRKRNINSIEASEEEKDEKRDEDKDENKDLDDIKRKKSKKINKKIKGEKLNLENEKLNIKTIKNKEDDNKEILDKSKQIKNKKEVIEYKTDRINEKNKFENKSKLNLFTNNLSKTNNKVFKKEENKEKKEDKNEEKEKVKESKELKSSIITDNASYFFNNQLQDNFSSTSYQTLQKILNKVDPKPLNPKNLSLLYKQNDNLYRTSINFKSKQFKNNGNYTFNKNRSEKSGQLTPIYNNKTNKFSSTKSDFYLTKNNFINSENQKFLSIETEEINYDLNHDKNLSLNNNNNFKILQNNRNFFSEKKNNNNRVLSLNKKSINSKIIKSPDLNNKKYLKDLISPYNPYSPNFQNSYLSKAFQLGIRYNTIHFGVPSLRIRQLNKKVVLPPVYNVKYNQYSDNNNKELKTNENIVTYYNKDKTIKSLNLYLNLKEKSEAEMLKNYKKKIMKELNIIENEDEEDEEEEEEEDDDDEDNEEEDEAKNENTYSGSNDGSEESKE